jgi:hypothetical protein
MSRMKLDRQRSDVASPKRTLTGYERALFRCSRNHVLWSRTGRLIGGSKARVVACVAGAHFPAAPFRRAPPYYWPNPSARDRKDQIQHTSSCCYWNSRVAAPIQMNRARIQ